MTAAATDQPTQPRDMQRRSGQRDFNARLRKARTIAAMPPASEGVTALGAALADQPDAPQFANAPGRPVPHRRPAAARALRRKQAGAARRLQRDHIAGNHLPHRPDSGSGYDLPSTILQPLIRGAAWLRRRHPGRADGGNVVRVLAGRVDPGVNPHTGPPLQTGAAHAFAWALEMRGPGSAWIEDVTRCATDFQRSIAFIATPPHRQRGLAGVLILKAGAKRPTDLMTNNLHREAIGRAGPGRSTSSPPIGGCD